MTRIASFIIFSFIEIILLASSIPICSDTPGYLGHPGQSTFSIGTDSFLWYLLYIFGDNTIWFKTLQIASILTFNLGVLLLQCSFSKRLLFSMSPFSFSVIALHFWGCGIRVGLATSFLFLAVILKEESKYQELLRYKKLLLYMFWLLLLASFLFHWSMVMISAILFVFTSNTFLHSISKLKYGLVHKKLIGPFLFLLCTIIIFFYVYSSKLNRYEFTLQGVSYGTRLPIIILIIFTYSLFMFFPFSSLSNKLHSKRGLSLLYVTSLLSLLPYLGFSELIVRITIPLQFFSLFYIFLDIKRFSELLSFALPSALPFLAYSYLTYLQQYVTHNV